ncbi:MAG TPA: TIGR02996 domain-containing protein [Gemmataceae bacterium]|nr:TIGR02996 domain-containing protein [Gemmataceae bacterium]
MAEREAFLAALAANEDDITTRLVYADWLDENGDHEEADRQRKWPAAKQWLVAFAKRFSSEKEDAEQKTPSYRTLTESDAYCIPITTFRMLIEMGHYGLSAGYIDCANNDRLCDELRADDADFWKNWSIVTGVPLRDDPAGKMRYACAC